MEKIDIKDLPEIIKKAKGGLYYVPRYSLVFVPLLTYHIDPATGKRVKVTTRAEAN